MNTKNKTVFYLIAGLIVAGVAGLAYLGSGNLYSGALTSELTAISPIRTTIVDCSQSITMSKSSSTIHELQSAPVTVTLGNLQPACRDDIVIKVLWGNLTYGDTSGWVRSQFFKLDPNSTTKFQNVTVPSYIENTDFIKYDSNYNLVLNPSKRLKTTNIGLKYLSSVPATMSLWNFSDNGVKFEAYYKDKMIGRTSFTLKTAVTSAVFKDNATKVAVSSTNGFKVGHSYVLDYQLDGSVCQTCGTWKVSYAYGSAYSQLFRGDPSTPVTIPADAASNTMYVVFSFTDSQNVMGPQYQNQLPTTN